MKKKKKPRNNKTKHTTTIPTHIHTQYTVHAHTTIKGACKVSDNNNNIFVMNSDG